MKFQMLMLAIVINLIYSLMLYSAEDRMPEMPLDWTHKDSETVFTFRKVQRVRDTFRFEILAQNMDKTWYKCIFVSTSDNHIHIDDEFGGEYRGGTVTFQGGSSRLALNQRKILSITMPAPKGDVSLVNIHFGLYAGNIGSDQNCTEFLINRPYNFHQLNWDVSQIR